MKLSTRTRYGMRLMLNLALSYGRGPIFLKDIAKQEEISEKYLSQIIIPLRTQGLVNSFRGPGGGYSLARLPSEITLREIVEALEGGLNLVEDLKDVSSYQQVSICVVRSLWNRLTEEIAGALNKVTLRDLVNEYQAKEGKTIMYNI